MGVAGWGVSRWSKNLNLRTIFSPMRATDKPIYVTIWTTFVNVNFPNKHQGKFYRQIPDELA